MAVARDAGDRATKLVSKLYGKYLVQYILAFACAAGVKAINLDEIESPDVRRADLLFVENDRGLVVEVKHSLSGSLSKYLLDPDGIVATMDRLLGAFRQCETTYDRKPWVTQGLAISQLAAVILVDEPVGAEGCVFADLLGAQTVVRLPFEVMSVTEFENAIGVLGVQGLADLIRQKWLDKKPDLPLQPTRRTCARCKEK